MDATAAPLFRQIADLVEGSVVDGSLAEGDRAPSTNELASFHSVNPATARKGLQLLVDRGILAKRRGVGMFVEPGARDRVLARRRDAFAADYLTPLIDEARSLGLTRADLHDLVERTAESRGLEP
ncbi:GntR family transcriptional regulator [uncultured Corynebacterium sp.]|uniref:GntR family transcriptional regulator n=1 Tax=uncultured Corynebacterium sp. TaxID=159447 RepID=UPI0025E40E7C|nr:GntR family transcriptional regulator [uncultured Corynebacterium sp.]